MRITEISVTKLFGIFDHTIPLNLDDRITIIHGPNGFGKTIILNMLNGLFSGHYSELLTVPFQRFQVRFDDDSLVWIDKNHELAGLQGDLLAGKGIDERVRTENDRTSEITVNLLKTSESDPLSFSLSSLISTIRDAMHDIDDAKITLVSRIDKGIVELYRVGPNEWIYMPTGETLSLDDIVERLGHRLIDYSRLLPDWWIGFQRSISIRLIQTQRLQNIRESGYSGRGSLIVPAVKQYAQELTENIREKLAASAGLSQSLDRSFPGRLVERMEDPNRSELTEHDLRAKLHELDEKRSRLIGVGLLDKEEGVASLPTGEITDDAKEVLSVYVQDVDKKLGVFDEIASKIDLFKDMINKRFLYKDIVISKESGFEFVISPNGKGLPLTALSSGEQHELVLLYQLLFKASPDSLILIDEPEISLHVAWQQEFLRDLQKITKLGSFDVLIATHSPQIIHDRWDLTVRLEGPAI